MQKISKLIDIEIEIAKIYNLIINLEITNQKQSASYMSFVNALNNLITDEERIMQSLNRSELQIIGEEEELDRILESKNITDPEFSEKIKERILVRGISLLAAALSMNSSSKKVADILLLESNELFLSHLDEEIQKGVDREQLIKFKYRFIYKLPGMHEKSLIQKGFNTEESLYISSLMYSQALHISEDTYESYKNILATNILDDVLTDLRDDFHAMDSADKTIAYLKLRTGFELLNNRLFEMIISEFEQFDAILSTLFSQSDKKGFIETLRKDRGRHKVLSLVPPKNGM